MTIVARHMTERGEVVLRQRDESTFEIIVDGVFLMASANRTSARELAIRGLAPLAGQSGLAVLVGGLGLGFTLAATLEQAGVAKVDVVEVEPVIVEWARGPVAHLNDYALEDPRVRVILGDIVDVVAASRDTYDAILLDTDNGPTWLVAESNSRLYRAGALERLRAMLAPSGVLAFWASEPSPDFRAELDRVLPGVEEVAVRDLVDGRELEHVLYLARAPGAGETVTR
jgi:spermidine synthase